MTEEEVAKARAPYGANLNQFPKGKTGLSQVGGYIYEEFLPQLQGTRAVKIYREMSENDPVIGAVLFAIDMFMRRVNWTVQAAGEDSKSEADKKFLEECKDDMSMTWPDFISEVNTMLPYGWSYFEVLYKRRISKNRADGNAQSKFNDGKIGWRKFDPRSQDSLENWDFADEDSSLLGMWQRPAPSFELCYIPIGKALLFRTTSRKNNPEGRSVLRNAYRPWYFKKRIEEIEGIGIERDLAGLPFAEVPAKMLGAEASDADKAMVNSIKTLVANVRRDQQEGVIWPQDWDDKGTPQYTFKLMSSGGTRQFSTDQTITRYEQRMAMTVLADFILLGNDSAGSYALSTSKSGMFQASLSAWLDIIKETLNNYAVPRLFRLNGVDGPYPTFAYDPVQEPSLQDLSVYVAALAGAGAQLFPDTDLENYFRERANMPLREDKASDSGTEQDLRTQTLSTQLAMQQQQEKQAKQPVMSPQQMIQQQQAQKQPEPMNDPSKPLGKQPGSVPGAPTKTTGPVKSVLPPTGRRRTAAVNASQNFAKRRISKFSKPQSELRSQVKEYLQQNYPDRTLDWVDSATWRAPRPVELDDVDMARRPGGRDPAKVKGIASAIRAGKEMEPVVLVDTNDPDAKLKIADGYHRTLAHNHAGKGQVNAWIGQVEAPAGPWDKEMHDQKLNKAWAYLEDR